MGILRFCRSSVKPEDDKQTNLLQRERYDLHKHVRSLEVRQYRFRDKKISKTWLLWLLLARYSLFNYQEKNRGITGR